MTATASVVIPAHNEAGVVLRTLTALLAGAPPGSLEVVVACNGCTDGTADLIRASGLPVRVIEIDAASKIAAMRAGDQVAQVFPRIYLDADVVLPGHSVPAVARALASAPAGRPAFVYDTTAASFLVRRYYAARSRVPELADALWGAGVYAVSRAGHDRVTPWPDVVADDLHVDRQFGRDEIVIVDTDPAVVRIPLHSRALLDVLGRAYLGKQDALVEPAAGEVGAGGGDRAAPTFGRTLKGMLRLVARRPWLGPDALVYVAFAVLGRARRAGRRHRDVGWARDETSRSM